MSHRGDCYDEVPMANFWRILERELGRHRCYATRERGRRGISECIKIIHNRQWYHSRLGNLMSTSSWVAAADSRDSNLWCQLLTTELSFPVAVSMRWLQ